MDKKEILDILFADVDKLVEAHRKYWTPERVKFQIAVDIANMPPIVFDKPAELQIKCGGDRKGKSFMCDVARRARDKVFMESLNKRLKSLKNTKDMSEKKFIKIEIPEGKELDEAAFKEGRIEWKPKAMTYEDIVKAMVEENDKKGMDSRTDLSLPLCSLRQAKKLCALNQLMNVAKYLNGDWKPRIGRNIYCLYLGNGKEVKIKLLNIDYGLFGDPCFKSEEDARKAIEILGEDVIRQALSTDY